MDARHEIGGNNPPSPFDMHSAEIDKLYDEAKLWLDGDPIDNQKLADGVSDLMALIRKARDSADGSRKEENRPFDEGKAEVQARYAPYISDTKAVKGKAALAIEACKKALEPWLVRQANEKREIEEKARRNAEEKRLEAEAAIRASNSENLAEREAAETLVEESKKAEIKARVAEKDRAGAGTQGRSAHLRSTWVPIINDPILAVRHYWAENQDEFEAVLIHLAKQDIGRGKRTIPGFNVKEVQSVI